MRLHASPRLMQVRDGAEALFAHLEGQGYRNSVKWKDRDTIHTELKDLIAWINRGQHTLVMKRHNQYSRARILWEQLNGMPSWPIIIHAQLAVDRFNRPMMVDFTALDATPVENVRTAIRSLLGYLGETNYRKADKRAKRREMILELESLLRWIADGPLAINDIRLQHYSQIRNEWEVLTGLIETTQISSSLGLED